MQNFREKEFICMEKLKQIPAAPKRLICFLLALICMLGLLPNTAFAAGPNTIVMEDCTHNGVYTRTERGLYVASAAA